MNKTHEISNQTHLKYLVKVCQIVLNCFAVLVELSSDCLTAILLPVGYCTRC